jgi:hypothetical protein
VSIVVVFHTQKMTYSELTRWINPYATHFSFERPTGGWNIDSPEGLAGIAGELASQSTNIGFINAFNLYLWTSLLVYPLIALIVWPPTGYRPQK